MVLEVSDAFVLPSAAGGGAPPPPPPAPSRLLRGAAAGSAGARQLVAGAASVGLAALAAAAAVESARGRRSAGRAARGAVGFAGGLVGGQSALGGVPVAGSAATPSVSSCTAMRAAQGGYKMSQAVPYLPVSPALEGYAGGDEEGFDPIGVSLAIDIRWLRESELKHGRTAMLAVVGWITTDLGVRLPGAAFQVSTIEAHDALVKNGTLPHMLVWFLWLELFGFLAIVNMMEGKTDRKPGDFYLRLLYPTDEKAQKDMQLKELRNGRLAMLAMGGIATSAVMTGKAWPFFATAPPAAARAPAAGSALCTGLSRSSASRAGLVAARGTQSASLPFLPKPQNLKGFVGEEQEFDPLGFSDTFDIRWLRESELKHGRVCMLATVGFAAQQYITFPEFTPTANALDSLYTSPVAGLATLLFISGYIESASYNGKITMLDMFEGSREPGNFSFGTWFLNGKSEKEVRDYKKKELENGRLAMFAIAGMVHHNLVVKGPLFPLIPDGWEGPQGSWSYNSVLGGILDDQVRA